VIVSLAIVVSAFVSLTLVPMLASRFLSDEDHKKRPGALVRSFERASTRCSRPTRTGSTPRCATGGRMLVLGMATLVPTVGCS